MHLSNNWKGWWLWYKCCCCWKLLPNQIFCHFLLLTNITAKSLFLCHRIMVQMSGKWITSSNTKEWNGREITSGKAWKKGIRRWGSPATLLNSPHKLTRRTQSPTCPLLQNAYPGNPFPSSSLSGKSMNTEGHLRRQVRISFTKLHIIHLSRPRPSCLCMNATNFLQPSIVAALIKWSEEAVHF